MKTRTGFVSNSSSCSFVVYKKDLTEEQKALVENYAETYTNECERANEDLDEDGNPVYCNTCSHPECIEDWKMEEEDDRYNFNTFMDNADLVSAFERLGIKVSNLGDW
jgi:hypothetical protein